MSQHPGLARPGAGEDQQRPTGMLDGLALGRVHPREKVAGVNQRSGVVLGAAAVVIGLRHRGW
ncbi:MAG: hypothetical protein ACRDK8_12625 [Solirubrobacteraceae bacterium]